MASYVREEKKDWLAKFSIWGRVWDADYLEFASQKACAIQRGRIS